MDDFRHRLRLSSRLGLKEKGAFNIVSYSPTELNLLRETPHNQAKLGTLEEPTADSGAVKLGKRSRGVKEENLDDTGGS